jgi:hypothetical protein
MGHTEKGDYPMGPHITPSANGKGNHEPLPPALKPLIELPRWVIWRWAITGPGQRTKVPYQAHNPRRKASTKNPSTWASYEGVDFLWYRPEPI